MKRRIYFLIIALVYVVDVSAKELVGRVTDVETGSPIENANVVLLGTTTGTSTNSAGYFQLDVKKGSTLLVISHVSYHGGKVEVEEGIEIHIQLQPKITILDALNIKEYTIPTNVSEEVEQELEFSNEEETSDAAFTMMEANATYAGGLELFYENLANLISSNGEFETKESVAAAFMVNREGEIVNIIVVPDSSSNRELVHKSLSQIDGWIPAIQGGKNANQTFGLEIYADEEVDEVFVIVEEPASFPGGMSAWANYLGRNMRYPKEARRMGVDGRVFVQFIVEKDGSVTDIKVLKGIGAGCDVEAMRVILEGPKWIPGKQRGVPIRQKMIQSILFRLGNSRSTSFEPSVPFGGRTTEARFPGGNSTYLDFLAENRSDFRKMVPPPNRFENNVRIQFDVDSSGVISKATILNGLGEPFDSEALRMVNLMPKWIPAFDNRFPISSKETRDISFNTIPYETRLKAVGRFENGNKHFSKKNYEKAVEFFSKAIEKNPTNLDFYFNRAVSFIELKKYEEACNDLSLIKERDEEAMKLYNLYCK